MISQRFPIWGDILLLSISTDVELTVSTILGNPLSLVVALVSISELSELIIDGIQVSVLLFIVMLLSRIGFVAVSVLILSVPHADPVFPNNPISQSLGVDKIIGLDSVSDMIGFVIVTGDSQILIGVFHTWADISTCVNVDALVAELIMILLSLFTWETLLSIHDPPSILSVIILFDWDMLSRLFIVVIVEDWREDSFVFPQNREKSISPPMSISGISSEEIFPTLFAMIIGLVVSSDCPHPVHVVPGLLPLPHVAEPLPVLSDVSDIVSMPSGSISSAPFHIILSNSPINV